MPEPNNIRCNMAYVVRFLIAIFGRPNKTAYPGAPNVQVFSPSTGA